METTPNQPLTTEARQHLREVRNRLLDLHKLLLDDERAVYEQLYGRISNQAMLQLLISDQRFAWLRRLSTLVVEIDELLASKTTVTMEDGQNLTDLTSRLLRFDDDDEVFGQKYHAALQRQPQTALLHDELVKLLQEESA